LHAEYNGRASNQNIGARKQYVFRHDLSGSRRNGGDRFQGTLWAYIDLLAGDPDLRDKVDKRVCSHAYWSHDLKGNFLPVRRDLREKLNQYPGWRFWQSEFASCKGQTMKAVVGAI